MMQEAVLLATYNEAENIVPLILFIRKSIPTAHIVIVDDDSPDGAANEVNESKAGQLSLHIRKEKRGYAASILEGFKICYEIGGSKSCHYGCRFFS
jgi:dolichol-phosphate mannosyltransferase